MARHNPPRHVSAASLEESGANSDSNASGNEQTKAIPFLRRLRDMLVENEDSISFIPGRRRSTGDAVTLGRIVVHDRVKVEADVLPRYFNHSSFASLRRQLNYFKFVRLGKGRQRESTYVNDGVVELDDVLSLKRRPSTASTAIENMSVFKRRISDTSVDSATKTTSNRRRSKVVLPLMATTQEAEEEQNELSHGAPSPVEDDEEEETDEPMPQEEAVDDCDDQELLAGCQALMVLSGKQWVSPY